MTTTTDPRTPGQVAHSSYYGDEADWETDKCYQLGWESAAAAVLAHGATARAEQNEMVVNRQDLETLLLAAAETSEALENLEVACTAIVHNALAIANDQENS